MSSGIIVKDVFTIIERESGEAQGGKNRWTKIGVGFVNRDESINIVLDANPVNGQLHVRDRQANTQRSQQPTQGGK